MEPVKHVKHTQKYYHMVDESALYDLIKDHLKISLSRNQEIIECKLLWVTQDPLEVKQIDSDLLYVRELVDAKSRI